MIECRARPAHRQRPLFWPALLATLSLFVAAPAAQDPPPSQDAPADAAQPTLMDADAVAARIEALKTLEEPDEVAQRELALLNQIVGDRKTAADAAALLPDLEKQRLGAPAELERVKAALAEPVTPPEIEPPADATIPSLEQALAKAQADLATAQKSKEQAATAAKNATDRLPKIPVELSEAQAELDKLPDAPVISGDDAKVPGLAAAVTTAHEARSKRLQQQIATWKAEEATLLAVAELLPAQLDLATRKITQLQKIVDRWNAVLDAARNEAARQQQEDANRAAVEADPAVRPVAEGNLAITQEQQEVANKSGVVSKEIKSINDTYADIEPAYHDLSDRIAQGGLTPEIGLLLRQERATLPDVGAINRLLRDRRSEMANAQFRIRAVRSEVRSLKSDLGEAVATALEKTRVEESKRESVEATVRSLLEQRRDEFLPGLLRELNAYFAKLDELTRNARKLAALAREYQEFINERELWIQSSPPISVGDIPAAVGGLKIVLSPSYWRFVGESLWNDTAKRPVPDLLAVLLVLALLGLRPRMLRRLRSMPDQVRRASTDRIGLTILALAITLAMAAPWPMLVWFTAHRLSLVPDPPEFLAAICLSIGQVAFVYFAFESIRQLCRKEGVAAVHFKWPDRNLQLVRRDLRWIIPVVIPLVYLAHLSQHLVDNTDINLLGRLSLVVVCIISSIALHRFLNPNRGIFAATLIEREGGWFHHLRYFWYVSIAGLPLALAVAACAGYAYTATELGTRFGNSILLVVIISVAYHLLLRWLMIAQRRLALRQFQEQRRVQAEAAAEARAAGAGEESDPEQAVAEAAKQEDDAIDVEAISAQTHRLLRNLAGLSVVVGLIMVWLDVLPALNIFEQVVVWTGTKMVGGEQVAAPVTLFNIGIAIVILMLTVVVGRNIPGLLEIAILQRLPITASARYAITTIARYLIIIVGVVWSFDAIEIGWGKVQWLAAAISVGLGFGLQEIVANFVSGIILLFERPIRVGDTVTVGTVSGTVTRIQMRATTIRDWDRKEIVIPNKSFITGDITNWTLTDRLLRLTVRVGIAYGSDTDLARRLLLKVADECERVLADPAPLALFLGFGDSSLDFDLRVYIDDMETLATRHALHEAIDNAFRDAGIEIAFPQRDLHFRTVPETLARATGAKSPEGE